MALTIREKSVISLHFWEFFWTSSSLRAARNSCSQVSSFELRRENNLQQHRDKDMDIGMKITSVLSRKALSTVCLVFLATFLATPVAAATSCYVIGNTSDNKLSKPLGSKANPYGSLAAVQTDTSCDEIVVLYSAIALDGGITLADGQELNGKTGENNALPIITNTTGATNGGHGVQLAANNKVSNLYIQDSYNSGIVGGEVGELKISDVLITGFGQGELVTPDLFGNLASAQGILLGSSSDVSIDISDTELGDASGTAAAIVTLAGHANVSVDKLTVRDLGMIDGTHVAAGVAVVSIGSSSIDADLKHISVSNIGAGISNSDGMVLIAANSSTMTVVVNEYDYLNPDGDGGGSATGLEIGNLFAGGATFDATVKNSTLQGMTSIGIQIVDQAGSGNNFLTAHIHDNEIFDSASSGIEMDIGLGGAPYGTNHLTIEDNLIVNAGWSGIEVYSAIDPQNVLNVLVQRNTVINSALSGLTFIQAVGASAATLNLDAGLGGLGSEGNNKIIDSQGADIYVETFDCCGFPATPAFSVDAANNWWGTASGPTTVTELGSATVDVDPFLTSEPDLDDDD